MYLLYKLFVKKFKLFKSNEFQFGLILSIIILIVALYPSDFSDVVKNIILSVSILFFLLSFLVPSFFKYPTKLWLKFGYILSIIVSPLILLILYIILIIPSGVFARLFNKIQFDDKFESNKTSYWKIRKTKISSFNRQF